VSERRTFKLAHAVARSRAVDAVKSAPDGYTVIVFEPTRSLDANALLHVWISEISRQKEWAGMKRDVDTWRRLLTAAWLRARGEAIEFLPALDGCGVDVVFRKTSGLSRGEFAELIEFTQAWAVENGVIVE